jgi:hypothetical protein
MMWSFNNVMDRNVGLHGRTGFNNSGGLKWSKALKGNIIFTCYDVPDASRVGFPSRVHAVEKLHQATMARTCRWRHCHGCSVLRQARWREGDGR